MIDINVSELRRRGSLWAGKPYLVAERAMFFWFLVAVAIVVGLTLLGAYVARGDGGWTDDGPLGPWEH